MQHQLDKPRNRFFDNTFDKLETPLSEEKRQEAEESLLELLSVIADMHK